MTQVALDCVPESQRKRMIWSSRVFMLIKIIVIFWAFIIESFLPLMFVTHETYRKNINNCIYMISNMKSIKDKPVVIQIYKV